MTETASTTRLETASGRTVIRHPMWCDSDEGDCRLEDWQYEAPAEQDEMHRARIFHVESGDVTLTVGLAQPFYMHEGHVDEVGEAVIEFTLHDHALRDVDAHTWLTAAEAEQLAHFLQEAAASHRRGLHLPTGRVSGR